MKRILIIGTGSSQIDAIKYLKEKGWYVTGISNYRDWRATALLDHFELIDIKDIISIKKLAVREKIDFIYSVGSDFALNTISEVSSSLSLPLFFSKNLLFTLMSKVKVREFLCKHDLNSVKYRCIKSPGDLAGWNIFPAIIKPDDSQGQRGIKVVRNIKEVTDRFDEVLGYSKSRTLILEEFLSGPEISVNAFVVNTEIVSIFISDRMIAGNYAPGIPSGHRFPSVYAHNMSSIIGELVKKCIYALDIKNGPVYFQIKLTDKGPVILEITPRLDGCHLWRLIKNVTGIDLLDACFNLLRGDKAMSFPDKPVINNGYLGYFLSPPGNIFCRDDYPGDNSYQYMEYYYEDGQIVRPINGIAEKVGYFIRESL